MGSFDIDRLRREIVAQAEAQGADGWMEIAVPSAVVPVGRLRVPRGAFEMWAVSRSGGAPLCAPWQPVCPVGVKRGADDPYHTDWMLGAGLAPDALRKSDALNDAAYAARAEVEKRLLSHECSVLLAGPHVVGRVVVPVRAGASEIELDENGLPPVLVVRDASPLWFEDAAKCLALGGAVVVERGGEMAHLVTEMRGSNAGPMIRVDGARTAFPSGCVVRVDPLSGSVQLWEDERIVREAMFQSLARTDDPAPDFEGDGPSLASQASDGGKTSWRSPGKGTTPSPRDAYGLERKTREVAKRLDALSYFEPYRKFHHAGYEVYVSLHSSAPPRQPWKAERHCVIEFIVVSPKPCRTLASYVGWERTWSGKEIAAAAREAVQMADPSTIGFYERIVDENERRDRAEHDRLVALPEAEFLKLARDMAEEEAGVVAGYRERFYDDGDLSHLRSEFSSFFRQLEWAASDRGLDVDIVAMRTGLRDEDYCPFPYSLSSRGLVTTDILEKATALAEARITRDDLWGAPALVEAFERDRGSSVGQADEAALRDLWRSELATRLADRAWRRIGREVRRGSVRCRRAVRIEGDRVSGLKARLYDQGFLGTRWILPSDGGYPNNAAGGDDCSFLLEAEVSVRDIDMAETLAASMHPSWQGANVLLLRRVGSEVTLLRLLAPAVGADKAIAWSEVDIGPLKGTMVSVSGLDVVESSSHGASESDANENVSGFGR